MKRSRILVGFGLMLLVPTAAYTYTLLSPKRHWASIPVTVCVEGPGHVSITANDLDRGVTATIQALNGTHPNLPGTGWNVTSVGTLVNAIMVDTARATGPCNKSWALNDGQPTIVFTDRVKGACAGSCLAVTFTGYYNCPDPALPDGHCVIDDADVQTRRNSADKYGGPYYSLYESCTSGREWNIEAIMVHEVGHVLGIGHSGVSGSTMYPSVSSCNSGPATISADPTTPASNDDALALHELY